MLVEPAFTGPLQHNIARLRPVAGCIDAYRDSAYSTHINPLAFSLNYSIWRILVITLEAATLTKGGTWSRDEASTELT